jgi:cytoskeletal protein CcmA (bactofilin family)
MAKKPDGVLNGFLDEGSHFKGELTFDDTMRIDGKFEGTIRSDHLLIIGDTGVVEADVRVGSVSIDGTLRGTVVAREKIEIHPHGRVFAKLEAPVLKIEEGATFQGEVGGADNTRR